MYRLGRSRRGGWDVAGCGGERRREKGWSRWFVVRSERWPVMGTSVVEEVCQRGRYRREECRGEGWGRDDSHGRDARIVGLARKRVSWVSDLGEREGCSTGN